MAGSVGLEEISGTLIRLPLPLLLSLPTRKIPKFFLLPHLFYERDPKVFLSHTSFLSCERAYNIFPSPTVISL
jgi:hypothetical protein